MDESSDDNLSFVSASDESEFEPRKENLGKSHLTLKLEDASRPASPALSTISTSSFRRSRQKRPAPPPPTKAPHSPSEPEPEFKRESPKEASSMTTFAQEFHRVAEEPKDNFSSVVTEASLKLVRSVASHPVVITSEGSEGGSTGKSFSNLQIRMIDDTSESLSNNVFTPQPAVSYSYPSPGQSSPFPGSPSLPSASPFYVASVQSNPTDDQFREYGSVAYAGTPTSPSVLPGAQQYVTIAPLGYGPTVTPNTPYHANSRSPPPSIITCGEPVHQDPSRSGPWNALAHSASDPGVPHAIKGSLVLPSNISLERLSEAEEDSSSYEEVRVRKRSSGLRRVGEGETGVGALVAKKKRFPPPLERSDSVTVAHLYEDIIVSSKWNFKVTFTNLSIVVVCAAIFMPNSAALLYTIFRLVFGTLFPAYYSYKAVRTKNVKEYVKWMMYWIVFAFFTCAETITDVFLSFWFPFYYEIKILVVLWLLSPATRGSSILYRKFVHPWLTKKEEEIDDCIAKAKQQGYSTVVQLGTKGVNYATSVIMQTAIKGGGGLVNQLKRSYSTSEIGEDTADHNSNLKSVSHKELPQSPSEDDDVSISSGSYESEPRHRAESESLSSRPRGHSTGRSVRTGKARSADVSEVYFHEAQEPVVQRRAPRTHDAGKYPTQLYREQPLRERVLRKGKPRLITRPKSLTIGGTWASREAIIEARRNHTTGSLYSSNQESS